MRQYAALCGNGLQDKTHFEKKNCFLPNDKFWTRPN